MGKFIDLTGQRFGRRTVLSHVGFNKKSGNALWLTRCDCDGNFAVVCGNVLRRGHANSCGCLNRERSAERNTKHGHRRNGKESPEYVSWQSMLARCYDKKHKSYPRYGGAGQWVDQDWQGEHGFENFLADMGPRPEGTTLDRKLPFLGYFKANCTWATPKEQSNNKKKDWLPGGKRFEPAP